MPGYLLDTNALSILAPRAASQRAAAADGTAFRTWVRAHDEQLFLSTITLAEVQAGVSRLERKGAAKRAADLARWLGAVLELYESRTLPLASSTALETGRMLDRDIGAGVAPDVVGAVVLASVQHTALMLVRTH